MARPPSSDDRQTLYSKATFFVQEYISMSHHATAAWASMDRPIRLVVLLMHRYVRDLLGDIPPGATNVCCRIVIGRDITLQLWRSGPDLSIVSFAAAFPREVASERSSDNMGWTIDYEPNGLVFAGRHLYSPNERRDEEIHSLGIPSALDEFDRFLARSLDDETILEEVVGFDDGAELEGWDVVTRRKRQEYTRTRKAKIELIF